MHPTPTPNPHSLSYHCPHCPPLRRHCPTCLTHDIWLTTQHSSASQSLCLLPSTDVNRCNLVVSCGFAYGMPQAQCPNALRRDPLRCALRAVSRQWREVVHNHSQRHYTLNQAMHCWRPAIPMVVQNVPRFVEQNRWIGPNTLSRLASPFNRPLQCASTIQSESDIMFKWKVRRTQHHWHIHTGLRWAREQDTQRCCARLRMDYTVTRRAFVQARLCRNGGWGYTPTATILIRRWDKRVRHHVQQYQVKWAAIQHEWMMGMRQCAFPGCLRWVGVWKGSRTVCMDHLPWKAALSQRVIQPSCWALQKSETSYRRLYGRHQHPGQQCHANIPQERHLRYGCSTLYGRDAEIGQLAQQRLHIDIGHHNVDNHKQQDRLGVLNDVQIAQEAKPSIVFGGHCVGWLSRREGAGQVRVVRPTTVPVSCTRIGTTPYLLRVCVILNLLRRGRWDVVGQVGVHLARKCGVIGHLLLLHGIGIDDSTISTTTRFLIRLMNFFQDVIDQFRIGGCLWGQLLLQLLNRCGGCRCVTEVVNGGGARIGRRGG